MAAIVQEVNKPDPDTNKVVELQVKISALWEERAQLTIKIKMGSPASIPYIESG
jgi:hypothetical protein